MKIVYGALIILAVLTIYVGSQASSIRSELTERVDGLETRVTEQTKTIDALQTALAESEKKLADMASLKETVSALVIRTKPAGIAASVLAEEKDDLIKAIAVKLAKSHADELRGPAGETVPAESVAQTLVTNGIAETTAHQIWKRRQDELISSEALIGAVADAVYKKYGADLKGEAAAPLSVESITNAVANDPAFAALVADSMPKN